MAANWGGHAGTSVATTRDVHMACTNEGPPGSKTVAICYYCKSIWPLEFHFPLAPATVALGPPAQMRSALCALDVNCADGWRFGKRAPPWASTSAHTWRQQRTSRLMERIYCENCVLVGELVHANIADSNYEYLQAHNVSGMQWEH